MVGSSDAPGASSGKAQGSGSPRVKAFSCPTCGASVAVRYPGASMTAVCDSCLSAIDVTDNNYRILTRYFAKTRRFAPIIPLGTRGELMGRRWEVIGFLVRMDIASRFTWEEYLLFNPYYGYRWLTHNAAHWSFVTTIKEKPTTTYDGRAILDRQAYQLFYDGRAEVLYVLGEFYWKVKGGTQVAMVDYINPPRMLSSETDQNEITWSLSEYVEPDVIRQAFKIKQDLPRRQGIGANQPSKWSAAVRPIAQFWVIFFLILTFLQICHIIAASNKTIFAAIYPYPGGKTSVVTPVFKAEKKLANLQLTFTAAVDNNWFYAAGELVNKDTGEIYPFERTVEYYHGVDSDGAWSEGGESSQLLLGSVPEGRYYLSFDTDSGGYRGSFELTIRRDVPTFANYFWCLLAISIVPAVVWWRSRVDEVSRWSQSDYSPYQSSDD